MKVLLVEDNQTNCFLLSDYLEFCGYSVHAIMSGSLFFSALESFQPDLVLLDLKMPKIDGYTLLEQLQLYPQWCHVPIIVISALSFRTHQVKALKLGARRYLVKPVVPDVLKQAIQEELAMASLGNRIVESVTQRAVIPLHCSTDAHVC